MYRRCGRGPADTAIATGRKPGFPGSGAGFKKRNRGKGAVGMKHRRAGNFSSGLQGNGYCICRGIQRLTD